VRDAAADDQLSLILIVAMSAGVLRPRNVRLRCYAIRRLCCCGSLRASAGGRRLAEDFGAMARPVSGKDMTSPARLQDGDAVIGSTKRR